MFSTEKKSAASPPISFDAVEFHFTQLICFCCPRTFAINVRRVSCLHQLSKILKGVSVDQIELFRNLVNMAAADKKFTDEEVQFLAKRAERWEISQDEFESTIAGIAEGGLDLHLPESHDDRVTLMKEMIRLMAADGEIADMERHLCALASSKMDFTGKQFEEILQSVIDEVS